MDEKKEKKLDCPKCKQGTMVNVHHGFSGNEFKCDSCGHYVKQPDPFDSMF